MKKEAEQESEAQRRKELLLKKDEEAAARRFALTEIRRVKAKSGSLLLQRFCTFRLFTKIMPHGAGKLRSWQRKRKERRRSSGMSRTV